MNQLEFFVASTECSRAEVRRYLRQLRELDELIEYHLDCLRYITEQRVQQLATSEGSGVGGGGDHDVEERGTGHKRRRASPAKVVSGPDGRGRESGRRGSTASDASPEGSSREALLEALGCGTPSSVRCGLQDAATTPLTGLPTDRLHAAYVFHRTRAMRHAEERKAIAAELAERAGELKGAMAVRLAQFEQGVEEDAGR